MRTLAFFVTWFVAYGLVVRYLYPTLGRWLHGDESPYYVRLAGVFAVMVLFVVLVFALPGAVLTLTGNPTLRHGRPLFGSDWREVVTAAGQLGLVAVGIRVGYDLLRKLPDAVARLRSRNAK